MNCRSVLVCVAAVAVCVSSLFASENADIIVAKDGSGTYTTIQDAINSIPDTNSSNVTILVKNGVYNERILIGKSHISIIGESRENTRIEYSLDRNAYQASRGKSGNNGSGVIDIGISVKDTFEVVAVTDIVIGNMTIINTLDSTGAYTHTVRGEAQSTKIWIVHCNVWAKGSDTIGLWNKTEGMYYHSDCNFKGGIDAVCPRGWCYAVNCQFYETAYSCPIWHWGLAGSTQKFVIRTPYVEHDTTFNFRLVNGDEEYEVYILDGLLSSKLKGPGLTSSVYYYNCHGIVKDTSWYADNLSSASDAPLQRNITAAWTFKDATEAWDPENTMPSVLPYSSLPQPWSKAYEIPSTVTLKWIMGRNATQNAIYMGTDSNALTLAKTQAENSYVLTGLESGTYYWRVDAVGADSTVKGAVWSFTVDQSVGVAVSAAAAVNKHNLTTVQHGTTITVSYTLTKKENVQLRVFDLQGREVVSLVSGARSAGNNSEILPLHTCKLNSGKYVISLKTGSFTESADMIIR